MPTMTRDRESLRRSVVSLSTLLITLFVVTLPAQVSGADDVVPIAVSSDFEVRSYLVENLGYCGKCAFQALKITASVKLYSFYCRFEEHRAFPY